MEIKTSKVKSVDYVKEYNSQHGTVQYHNLTMDNGDKINIGKKTILKNGDEITYKIVGDVGQHDYVKSKTPSRDEMPSSAKPDNYTKGIEVGHAVNNAVNMLCAGFEFSDIMTDDTEEKIKAYARKILSISNDLKNE